MQLIGESALVLKGKSKFYHELAQTRKTINKIHECIAINKFSRETKKKWLGPTIARHTLTATLTPSAGSQLKRHVNMRLSICRCLRKLLGLMLDLKCEDNLAALWTDNRSRILQSATPSATKEVYRTLECTNGLWCLTQKVGTVVELPARYFQT